MQNLELLKQLAAGIHKLLGTQCEIAIHDFSNLEHSIAFLEGNITGRSVRGAATDLILSQVRQGTTDQDAYNYQTHLTNGRVMKSCTLYLRDDEGNAYGAFCINLDITTFTAIQGILDEFLATSDQEITETFSDDIQGTIHSVLMETVREIGNDVPIMSRDEKLNLIARLDEKGIFQVKRSVPILAEELGLSRSTLYNYLSETRGDHLNSQVQEKE